jgi:hypothetical protein
MENELTGLFQVLPPRRRGFPAFAISTTLHGAGIAMISWVLIHNPTIVRDPISKNYKMRHLELHTPETAASRAAEALYPNQNKATKRTAKRDDAGHGDSSRTTAQAEPRPRNVPALRLPEGGKGKQVLVQPEIHTRLAMNEQVPLPNVMVWTPELKPAETIVPPTPEQLTTVDVQTSLAAPNEELKLADLPLTAADRQPAIETPPAGNTSPVAVQSPSDVKMAPATASTPSAQPTPAAVLSVSDLRMNAGTVALPPVNETRGENEKDGATGGPAGTQGIGEQAAAAETTVADAANAAQDELASGEPARHIQLPPDGKFSVVVVGSSLSDQYPEALDVWSDRVAYTAYLHVGTPKAWILQYAQLREADATAGGSVAHLDAPWPYDILRPNLLSKDLNADALMVHGVLNESGRLVNLAIAYPAGYVHSSYVLHELQQWQFRPAEQRGKPTAVEVLLIIPEEND